MTVTPANEVIIAVSGVATAYRFRIHGTSPLLLHNPASMQTPDEGLKAKSKSIPTPEVEAERAAYRMDDGQLYVPAIAFKSAIATAAKGRKIGKVFATQAVRAVFVLGDAAPLVHPDDWTPLKDYEIDSRRAMVQNNGITRNRPKLVEWGTEVEMELDEDFINVESVVELLTIAGRVCGVGDYRPQNGGPFGRFRVHSFFAPSELA